jgi:hypothetical protein
MEKRYMALRIIGNIYKILGILVLAITIIGVIGICGMSIIGGTVFDSFVSGYGNGSSSSGLISGIIGGLLSGLILLLYGGLTSITLYALGEGVYLLIAIEENTRKTSLLLEGRK